MFFPFFKPKIKASFNSPFNGTIQVGKSYGQETMFVDYAPQSGGELQTMWEKVAIDIQKISPDMKKCLMLGIGGGTMINCLKKLYSATDIQAVDIDPIIVGVGKKYFGLKTDKRLELIINDADKFVTSRQQDNKYDLIIVDLYIKDKNPDFARKKEFLLKIKILLQEKGIVIFNSHYIKKESKEFADFTKICAEVFSIVSDIFQYPRNHILLLRD